MSSAKGLFCPYCGKKSLRTSDTRPTAGGIRRRKECTSCSGRFSTVETIAKIRKTR